LIEAATKWQTHSKSKFEVFGACVCVCVRQLPPFNFEIKRGSPNRRNQKSQPTEIGLGSSFLAAYLITSLIVIGPQD